MQLISLLFCSISPANLSMILLCFSPIRPVLLLALSKLMFLRWICACELVLCINDPTLLILLQFFQSILPMIDFSKIYCKDHPYELINNFCTDRNCLVGLCPTCICQHTQMHMRNKTQPQFQNIRTTFTRVHEEIQDQIEVISKDKERLGSLVGSIKEKKAGLKGILQKARADCLQLVKEHFDELEKSWESSISCQEKKHSLHSSYRLDTLSSLISKQLSQLIDESRRMNSIAFVDEIPRITKESLVQSRAFHHRLSQEFEDNQKYTPIINYTAENLKDVTLALKKLLTLEFSIPVKKYLSSSASSQALGRTSINFKQQPQKETLTNYSLVIKRQSVEKINTQAMSHSALFSVPMVLTSSYVNSPVKPQLSNQSEIVDKPRTSKISFTPNYIDRVQLPKHAKLQNRSQVKPKKSGLTLSGRQEVECSVSQKQNSRR